MAIENVKQLKKVNGQYQAQELLDKGWMILAACVCQDGSSQYAEYHLGHSAPKVEQPRASVSRPDEVLKTILGN